LGPVPKTGIIILNKLMEVSSMASNQKTVVDDAYRQGTATASTWTCNKSDYDTVSVVHHNTHMIDIIFDAHFNAVKVVPINAGWGSTTDRCGIRKITDGAGISTGYRELFNC